MSELEAAGSLELLAVGGQLAEITRKRIGELVRNVFALLLDHPEGLPAKEILAQLENRIQLTEFERSDYPNHPGVRRFDKIVRFATIGPVKAGWLIKTKGKWILTEEGKNAYKEYKDPEQFARKAAELYRHWKAGQPESIDDSGEAPVENPTTTFEEAE